MREPIKIAFYGKGGIGKSTIASNISAAMAHLGLKVLFIGCDPKSDSVKNIVGGKINPIINQLIYKGDNLVKEDFLKKGFLDVVCLETGGPSPGVGCAGRGIITMMEELDRHDVLDDDWDVIIYDVLGDVVCGGFAVPMREGYVDCVLLVSSSEYMSIYAANNILKSIEVFSDERDAFLGGLIYNHRNNESMAGLVNEFADKTGVPIISEIPFSKKIIFSELDYKTVIEKYPDSDAAKVFIDTAKKILSETKRVIPKPLDDNKLEKLSKEYLSMVADGEKYD